MAPYGGLLAGEPAPRFRGPKLRSRLEDTRCGFRPSVTWKPDVKRAALLGRPSSFPCSVRSVLRQHRAFGRLPGQLLERLREVLAIVQEIDAAGALLHQKGDQRGIGLGRVALPTGEDQIVRTVVGGLPTAGTNMIQRDDVGRRLGAAVGAHRTMKVEEPIAVRLHGAAG